jgi:hypothetical protein
MRLRELAANRVRFGYRRLTVLLKREGWRVNAKRIYRLYTEEGLTVRTKYRKKAASRSRMPQGLATAPNQRWSMDFVSDRFVDDRWFRVLTVVDQFTRECLLLYADRALSSSGPDGICASSPNQVIGLLRPCPPQVLKKLVSAICAIFSGSSISTGIFSSMPRAGRPLRARSATTRFEHSCSRQPHRLSTYLNGAACQQSRDCADRFFGWRGTPLWAVAVGPFAMFPRRSTTAAR